MAKIKVGDKAPDFVLPREDGRQVSLRDFAGKQNVVLYFYPKDFTMGCTAETKAFGSRIEEFRKLDAEVIGISSDSAQSHHEFADACGASFPLLSDEEKRVRELYGATGRFGLIPERVTFVIDKEGIVRHIFSSQINPRKHVEEAREALAELAQSETATGGSVQATSANT
jgi:peroxiredoxin Q/BCP